MNTENMIIKDTPEPAFPACNEANVNGTMGMTLRDYFAAQMLVGYVSGALIEEGNRIESIAEQCYFAADAMLEARK